MTLAEIEGLFAAKGDKCVLKVDVLDYVVSREVLEKLATETLIEGRSERLNGGVSKRITCKMSLSVMRVVSRKAKLYSKCQRVLWARKSRRC